MLSSLSLPACSAQVLVNGLANSRLFQRFAIRSNAFFSEMSKKGAEGQGQVAEKASSFVKTFRCGAGGELRVRRSREDGGRAISREDGSTSRCAHGCALSLLNPGPHCEGGSSGASAVPGDAPLSFFPPCCS